MEIIIGGSQGKVELKTFNPEFINKDWQANGQIGEEESLFSVCPNDFYFLECVRKVEEWIPAKEFRRRVKSKRNFICFGANVLWTLLSDHREHGRGSILDSVYDKFGKSFMAFFREVFIDPYGVEHILYLKRYEKNGNWDWYWNKLRDPWSCGFNAVGFELKN